MGYEDVISEIGEFNGYQKRVFFYLCLPALICAFHEMGGVFLAAKTDFRCLSPYENSDNNNNNFTLSLDDIYLQNISHPWNNETNNYSQCERYNLNPEILYKNISNLSQLSIVKCDSFVYDRSQYSETISTEWNLVCDKAWLRATGDSAFMIGVMFGSIIFSGLSDKYGRKPILIIALMIQLISGFIVAVSPDLITYMISRSIVGSATSGVFLIAFVIALEMVGPKTRLKAEMGFQSFFTIGYNLVTILAYCIRNWRILQIAFVIPSLGFLTYWWLIPESIRWLLSKGRVEEAKKLIYESSLKNGSKLSQEILDNLLIKDLENDLEIKEPSAFDLFRYPNMRKKSLLIFFMWFVNGGTYYGLSWNTSSLAGNDYINFGIAGFVELPAYLFLILTLDRWGRRTISSGSMLLAGTSLLCATFVPPDIPWLVVVFAMIGKFAIACSTATILIFAAELFPTVIRNIGLGASGICARIGAIFAPYINLLSEIWGPLPLAIFGFGALIAGLLTLFLPETLHEKLPESIQDGEDFGKRKEKLDRITMELT